jgi:predicted Zn-ribbon and HTH transcriptional regulator
MADASSEIAPGDGGSIGLRHEHGHEAAVTIGELRRAQRSLHWDTSLSRILYVEVCHVCGQHDRQSVKECAQPDCKEHRICEERFR